MSVREGLSIDETLEELLRLIGPNLLNKPLLLEAYLRDLHPEEPAVVFALVESLRSGVVERLLSRETERDCVARLTNQSALSGKSATHCVRLWLKVLPRPFFGRSMSIQSTKLTQTHGSIATVFEGFRIGGIDG